MQAADGLHEVAQLLRQQQNKAKSADASLSDTCAIISSIQVSSAVDTQKSRLQQLIEAAEAGEPASASRLPDPVPIPPADLDFAAQLRNIELQISSEQKLKEQILDAEKATAKYQRAKQDNKQKQGLQAQIVDASAPAAVDPQLKDQILKSQAEQSALLNTELDDLRKSIAWAEGLNDNDDRWAKETVPAVPELGRGADALAGSGLDFILAQMNQATWNSLKKYPTPSSPSTTATARLDHVALSQVEPSTITKLSTDDDEHRIMELTVRLDNVERSLESQDGRVDAIGARIER
jgi:hypothetical protein